MKGTRSVRLPMILASLALLTTLSLWAHEGGSHSGGAAQDQRAAVDPRTVEEREAFKARTGAQMIAQINAEMVEAKIQLMREGHYVCCTTPGCTQCVLSEGACSCRDDLKAGGAVCPECKAGWDAGKGSVTGYTAKDVKTSVHGGEHHGAAPDTSKGAQPQQPHGHEGH